MCLLHVNDGFLISSAMTQLQHNFNPNFQLSVQYDGGHKEWVFMSIWHTWHQPDNLSEFELEMSMGKNEH